MKIKIKRAMDWNIDWYLRVKLVGIDNDKLTRIERAIWGILNEPS